MPHWLSGVLGLVSGGTVKSLSLLQPLPFYLLWHWCCYGFRVSSLDGERHQLANRRQLTFNFVLYKKALDNFLCVPHTGKQITSIFPLKFIDFGSSCCVRTYRAVIEEGRTVTSAHGSLRNRLCFLIHGQSILIPLPFHHGGVSLSPQHP